MRRTRVITLVALAAAMLALTACERKITRVETASEPQACTDCHVANNLITGKETQWAVSGHGTGTAFEEEGTRASCAGCHSGNAFQEMIAGGLSPNQVTSGDTDPTRQDCRACHMIHDTYTMADFALRTTQPVALYAVPGTTYAGGEGNLCVNCHQPRRDAPVASNGVISGISTHWGPHHGPQSSMLLGKVGAGVTGAPMGHYTGVTNTCVSCHLGGDANHTFEPQLAVCVTCHPGATDFDINGVQTFVEQLSDSLGDELLSLNLIDVNTADGHPTVTSAPENQGIALWNWLYVAHEDKSKGVHNPTYAIALLQEGLARLAPPALATRSSH